MEKITSVILAFVILFSVLFVIPQGLKFDVKYIARSLEYLGSYKPPSLVGSFDVKDGFGDIVGASGSVITYPIRLVYYIGSQIVRALDLFFNFDEYNYYFEHTQGGFGGGSVTN